MLIAEVDKIPFDAAVVYREGHDRDSLAIGYVRSYVNGDGTVRLHNRRRDEDCRVPVADVLARCPDPRALRTE